MTDRGYVSVELYEAVVKNRDDIDKQLNAASDALVSKSHECARLKDQIAFVERQAAPCDAALREALARVKVLETELQRAADIGVDVGEDRQRIMKLLWGA